MRKESLQKQGLVDYNVGVFQSALKKVLELGDRTRSASQSGSIVEVARGGVGALDLNR